MKVVTIGRGTDNDVIINDSRVSRHHLQIIQNDDGTYKLFDFGSTNGTYVNGVKINGEIPLFVNDTVSIGNTKLNWCDFFNNNVSKTPRKKSKKVKILLAILIPSIFLFVILPIIIALIMYFKTIPSYIIDNDETVYNDEVVIDNQEEDDVLNFEEQEDQYKEEVWNDDYWSNPENKSLLQLVQACDYMNPNVRNTAVKIAGKYQGEYNIAQVCAIFDNCYKSWHYVNDPEGKEYHAKASESIKNGYNGDCDDFAILICSMILSIGGDARINFVYGPSFAHAFTEVNISKFDNSEVREFISKQYDLGSDKTLWYREGEDGKWLNLDWQASFPGGDYLNYSNGTAFYVKSKKMYNF